MRVVWPLADTAANRAAPLCTRSEHRDVRQRQWFFHGSPHGVTRCPDGDILLGRMSRALSPQTDRGQAREDNEGFQRREYGANAFDERAPGTPGHPATR